MAFPPPTSSRVSGTGTDSFLSSPHGERQEHQRIVLSHARHTLTVFFPPFLSSRRLALYVYEYLLHCGAQKAAQTFLSEVSVVVTRVTDESLCFLTNDSRSPRTDKMGEEHNTGRAARISAFLVVVSCQLVDDGCVCDPCLGSVFWDLYCAAPERRDTCEHSSEAKAFHDYVS